MVAPETAAPTPRASRRSPSTRRYGEITIESKSGPKHGSVELYVDGSNADEFDTERLAVVPDDQAMRLGTTAGRPLDVYAPNSPAARAYRQLEANMTDGVLPP